MFADSMLESSWAQRSQRNWSTLTSFSLQGVGMVVLVMIPLLSGVGVPLLRPLTLPISLARMPAPLHVQVTGAEHIAAGASTAVHPFQVPRYIPINVDMSPDKDPAGSDAGPAPDIGIGGGSGIEGVYRSFPSTFVNTAVPKPPVTVPHTLRVSHPMEGSLIHRVEPIYPGPARSMRVQGQVVLSAIISKEGTIENLRTLSGHPLLVAAAVAAVRQWRYRPFMLNNEPVEVETRVTVNFTLSAN